MAEHRVPMLSPALHRQPDPEHSRDPRVRALVGHLRTLEVPGPRPEFRAELRAQLVAITPRIVDEGDAAPAAPRRRPSPGVAAIPAPATATAARRRRPVRTALARIGQIKVGKPLAVITCVVAVFAVLLGGAVWISKRALPGDTLYGLKRASEQVQQAMTTGDTARAKLLLDFADNRYGEVADLVPDAGTAPSSSTASLVTDTLNSADDDLRQAMQTLGAQAIRNRSGSGLGLVTGWAGAPLKQLRGIVAGIPAGDVHRRAAASLALLTKADHRAAQLKALGDCGCLAHTGTDALGAKPCTKCSSAVAPAVPAPATRTRPANGSTQRPAGATSRAPAASTSAHRPASSTGNTGSGTASSNPAGPSQGGSTSVRVPAIPGLPGLPGLPSLPAVVPSNLGSCTGLDLGLISVGRCGVGLGG